MNVRRGAFRLWIVASIAFVLLVGLMSYDSVHTEFHNAYTDFDAEFARYGGSSVWPVLCSGAASRGMIGTDYSEKDGICWYDSRTFRKLYPEYKDLSNRILSGKLYAAAGQPLVEFHPWQKLMRSVAVALGCPLAILIAGWGLFWAFAGFKDQGVPNDKSRGNAGAVQSMER